MRSGTVFFGLTESWSWLDAYFFTVVTLPTVGYGSLVSVTAAGKIGTPSFIFVGLGAFAVTIQQFVSYTLREREHGGHLRRHPAGAFAHKEDRSGPED
ncbi:two pore domain potassium channel family protein [Pseudohalocynthiibacter aestuariivivens]|nr:potassium channel family protein [Pseudohalocynthiibacter aestuariivivens]QIE44431.1 two pore domain potassium channel family protein [Pseudohalocynthiibacter aestuariivivens]